MGQEYTKGEWKQEGLAIKVFGAGTVAITPSLDDGGVFERVANAQLIASAPDEDKCLRDFGLYVAINYDAENKPVYYIDKEWLDMRTKALAKAEGK